MLTLMLAQDGSASQGQFHSVGYHMCWCLQSRWRAEQHAASGGAQLSGTAGSVCVREWMMTPQAETVRTYRRLRAPRLWSPCSSWGGVCVAVR
jgi:hypothetical protein